MQLKIFFPSLYFLLISLTVKAAETYQATARLNIRNGIGTSHAVVGSIEKGEKILIDTIVSGWGRILVNGEIKGYASMKYLSKGFKNSSKIDFNNSSSSSKEESSIWKSILTIIVLIVIGYYQMFGKNKSNSSNEGSPRNGGTSYSSEKQNTAPAKKTTTETMRYYCRNCGKSNTNLKDLVGNPCFQHPNGRV